MEIIVDKKHDNLPLLTFLTHELGLSRRSISRLKRLDRGIVLNGDQVTVRALLHEGDRLVLMCEDEKSAESILPSNIPIDIIYEDDDIIAVNKPPHMPTHPSHGHYTDTLANAAAYYFESRGIPFVFRAANRLDRDTSGIVLIAKNRHAAYCLSNEVENRQTVKCYLAVLSGIPSEKSGRIIAYIRRKKKSIITREALDYPTDDSSFSETLYKVIGEGENACAAVAMPITGRTHQLRLHFAHIGHPIIGDDMYGSASDLIDRQALHAYSLTFAHPSSENGTEMSVYAPFPEDILSLLRSVKISPDKIYDGMKKAVCELTDLKQS